MYVAAILSLVGFGNGNTKTFIHVEDCVLAIELCIVLLTISVLPSFYIFNSLINQMIKSKQD